MKCKWNYGFECVRSAFLDEYYWVPLHRLKMFRNDIQSRIEWVEFEMGIDCGGFSKRRQNGYSNRPSIFHHSIMWPGARCMAGCLSITFLLLLSIQRGFFSIEYGDEISTVCHSPSFFFQSVPCLLLARCLSSAFRRRHRNPQCAHLTPQPEHPNGFLLRSHELVEIPESRIAKKNIQFSKKKKN